MWGVAPKTLLVLDEASQVFVDMQNWNVTLRRFWEVVFGKFLGQAGILTRLFNNSSRMTLKKTLFVCLYLHFHLVLSQFGAQISILGLLEDNRG